MASITATAAAARASCYAAPAQGLQASQSSSTLTPKTVLTPTTKPRVVAAAGSPLGAFRSELHLSSSNVRASEFLRSEPRLFSPKGRSPSSSPSSSSSSSSRKSPRISVLIICKAANDKTVVIGLAADSGCGKSTFMRRLTSVFGGAASPPKGGNPDSNTLISDTTTVICLDDYHSLDRTGRKVHGVTALDPRANNFDLMYEQVKALKEGKTVEKPVYNHVSGLLDPAETIAAPKILVIEGLHPMYDERVRELLDFSVYLDISDDVKFAWKIQRDMAERGHSLESIKASIAARKPDFDAYIDTQKQYADVVIQVLPTQLIPDDNEGKILRVRMIMKEGLENFVPAYLFDEGSTVSWVPCGRKLTCSYPGIKFFYGPDTYYGQEVSVLEMDGQFDKLEELIYVESHLSNTSTKFYGEITQQMLRHADFPGSNNGTGLFQTIVGLKIREVYERIVAKEVVPV
uniref:Phosphoribulokinase n=1 Tax=Chara braunii TaxID=69332 RepID=G3XHR1_CHABU|nr:chloroplast phosphoribulokinase [Chara braunii]